MSILSALRSMIPRKCPLHSDRVHDEMRKLRRAADMNLVETSNSTRLWLDNIESQRTAEKTIGQLVEFMSRERDETGRS